MYSAIADLAGWFGGSKTNIPNLCIITEFFGRSNL